MSETAASAYQCAANANQCAIEAAESAQRAAQAAEIAEAAAHIAQSHAQNQQAQSSGLRCRVQVRIGNKRLTYSQHHDSEAEAAEAACCQFRQYVAQDETIRITAHAAPHKGEAP